MRNRMNNTTDEKVEQLINQFKAFPLASKIRVRELTKDQSLSLQE